MIIDVGWLDERVKDSHMRGHSPCGTRVEMAAVLVYQRVRVRHGDDDRRLRRRRRVTGKAQVRPPWDPHSKAALPRVHCDTLPLSEPCMRMANTGGRRNDGPFGVKQ